jgi:hypothetical protein
MSDHSLDITREFFHENRLNHPEQAYQTKDQ